MGLFDGIKGIFTPKSDEEKIAKWKEDGNSEKISAFTEEGYEQSLRLLAVSALGEIKRDETAVNTCMKLITDDDKALRIAACEALKLIGTKREVDRLYFVETNETDDEVKRALIDAAVASKERTPRFL